MSADYYHFTAGELSRLEHTLKVALRAHVALMDTICCGCQATHNLWTRAVEQTTYFGTALCYQCCRALHRESQAMANGAALSSELQSRRSSPLDENDRWLARMLLHFRSRHPQKGRLFRSKHAIVFLHLMINSESLWSIDAETRAEIESTRVARESCVRRSGPRSDSSHAMAATPTALRALAGMAMGNLTPEGQDCLRASLLSYEKNGCSEDALVGTLQMMLCRPEYRRRISYAPPCQQPTPQVAGAAFWPAGDGTLSSGHVTAFTKILCAWPFSGAVLCPLACTCRDLSTMAPSNNLYRKRRHFVRNQDTWIMARTTVEEMDAFVERCHSLFRCALAQQRRECFACGCSRGPTDCKTMASVVELCQQCFAAFRWEMADADVRSVHGRTSLQCSRLTTLGIQVATPFVWWHLVARKQTVQWSRRDSNLVAAFLSEDGIAMRVFRDQNKTDGQ
eukprot:s3447_g7.t1